MASKTNPWCLHPGRLTQRVTLKSPATPTDGETNPTMTTTISGVPAEVLASAAAGRAGTEVSRGEQMEGKTLWYVTLRYRSDVTPAWQLAWNGKTLEVYSCYDPVGTRTYLELLCYEVNP